MDLEAIIQQVEDEIAKKRAMVDRMQKDLDAKSVDLATYEDALKTRELVLADWEKKIQGSQDAIDSVEELKNKALAQAQKESDLADLAVQLKKQENDLVAVKAGLDQREAIVTARETAVSEREVEYKQTLKDEFFAEVSKRMPQ